MRQQRCRILQLLILAILAFSLVSACRGNSSQQALQADNRSAEAVQVIEHARGKTKVPINPQRVVVLGGGLDTVLSLGIVPVGSVQVEQDYYLTDRLAGVNSVGSSDKPNLEAIVALKPDLILGAEFDGANNYELLSQIAPTVITEVSTSGDWQKMLNKYAEALGETDKAKQIMADYHARIKEFQTQMGDRLQQTEVSIIRVRQDQTQIYLEDSFCGTVVADAGLPRPPDQANTKDLFSIDISKELLQKADGDVIFVWTWTSGETEEIVQDVQTALKQLKADPLWARLKAVQQDEVYDVPNYWIGMGPIAANLVLDDLFKYLIKADVPINKAENSV